jgi:hypothetical protein
MDVDIYTYVLFQKCNKMAKITGRSATCHGSNKDKPSGQVKYAELQSMENTGKCYNFFQLLY